MSSQLTAVLIVFKPLAAAESAQEFFGRVHAGWLKMHEPPHSMPACISLPEE